MIKHGDRWIIGTIGLAMGCLIGAGGADLRARAEPAVRQSNATLVGITQWKDQFFRAWSDGIVERFEYRDGHPCWIEIIPAN